MKLVRKVFVHGFGETEEHKFRKSDFRDYCEPIGIKLKISVLGSKIVSLYANGDFWHLILILMRR